MRKPAIATFAVLSALALTLAGCSSDAGSSAGAGKSADTPAATQEQPKPQPADLTGEWVQEDAGDSSQSATITADTISVNWISTKDDTVAVYWVGTYQAPTEAGDFTWTSTRDEAATDTALLASTDPTKEFTYAGDKVSYKVSAMGVTKTVTLVRK